MDPTTTSSVAPPPIDLNSLVQLQKLIDDFLKDRVCHLENDAARMTDIEFHESARQLSHAARELNFTRRDLWMLLNNLFLDGLEEWVVESAGSISKPSLPQI